MRHHHSISGLVVEYIVAIDVTRVRFPADAGVGEAGKGGRLEERSPKKRQSARETAPGVRASSAGQLVRKGAPESKGPGSNPSAEFYSLGCGSQFESCIHSTHETSSQHQWSSARIHPCHRCDPASIPC